MFKGYAHYKKNIKNGLGFKVIDSGFRFTSIAAMKILIYLSNISPLYTSVLGML